MSAPLAVLRDPAATLAAVLGALEAAEADPGLRPATAGLSSNVTIDLLGTFLRRQAVLAGVRLRVAAGSLDDPIGDLERFQAQGVDLAVLLPFFDALLPAFEAQAGHLAPELLDAREADFRARYRMAFQKGAAIPRVVLAGLHPCQRYAGAGVREAVRRFDQALAEEARPFPNVQRLELAGVLSQVGEARALDPRMYLRALAPYTPAFHSELARRIAVLTRDFGGEFRKVLVLDCDNTLWGGTAGEDLAEGIRLGPFGFPANVFWQAQHVFATLEARGVLLALCSRNNPGDVEEILASHPGSVLRAGHFAARKVNWLDKVENLEALARELDLGLESFVFLDDSAFEVEAVRSRLPMVRAFQVPGQLSDYPNTLAEIADLFPEGADAASRTGQYLRRGQAEQARARFASTEDYLASLDLRLTVAVDDPGGVARIAELTQKSNQFNLTTRRCGAGEIARCMADPDCTVFSLTVEDRFGGAGLTGALIVRWGDGVAEVDSFLLSCRVLGRGLEFPVWNVLAACARSRGCPRIRAAYLPTAKNGQVADFFDRLGLPRVAEEGGARRYDGTFDAMTVPPTPWIRVLHAE